MLSVPGVISPGFPPLAGSAPGDSGDIVWPGDDGSDHPFEFDFEGAVLEHAIFEDADKLLAARRAHPAFQLFAALQAFGVDVAGKNVD